MMKGILKDYVAYCEACDEAGKAHRKGSAFAQFIFQVALIAGIAVASKVRDILKQENEE